PPSASSCRDPRDQSCPRSRGAWCARICLLPSRFPGLPLVPMTRIERVTSPLPRECSTTELHGRIRGSHPFCGAGEGNRTFVISLEGFCSTIELHPPSNRSSTRPSFTNGSVHFTRLLSAPGALKAGGGGWIRTNVGARPTDLQSAPFSRSGTPPAEPEIMRIIRRLVKKSGGNSYALLS